MSDVKKWYIGVYGGDAQARPCSPAEFEIIHAGEGRYFVLAEDFDNATRLFLDAAERCLASERREKELQQRLTAADDRADRLETGFKWESDRNALLLASLTEAEDMLSVTSLEAGQRIEVLEGLLRLLTELPGVRTSGLWERVVNALKPADGRNSPTCTWSHDAIGIWAGSCGTKWAFTDDGPTENGMRFCHSCGKTLVVDDEDEGDDA